jgi:hypothetical protein
MTRIHCPQLLTALMVLTVFSQVARILMILLPARPSRLNVISMPQAASKRGGIFRPAGTVPRNAVTAAPGAGTQKVGRASVHELRSALPHASGDHPFLSHPIEEVGKFGFVLPIYNDK